MDGWLQISVMLDLDDAFGLLVSVRDIEFRLHGEDLDETKVQQTSEGPFEIQLTCASFEVISP